MDVFLDYLMSLVGRQLGHLTCKVHWVTEPNSD